MKAFCLSTLILSAFVLAACSTPDDLISDPNLSPQFGTRGFDQVTDVAYGKALTLYAVGTWNDLDRDDYDLSLSQDAFVRRYDRSGNLIWENYLDLEPAYEDSNAYDGYTSILSARAVAVDGGGNALVAWSGVYTQRVFDEFGNPYPEVAATFNYLTKYSPSGRKLWRVYTSGALTDLATDSSGNIYATSGSALVKYTSGGAQSWSRSQSQTPTGVTVSSTNNVYIVRRDGAVLKYNASGTQLYLKTGQLDGFYNGGYFFAGAGYRVVAGVADELYVVVPRYLGSGSGCDASYFYENYAMKAFKLSNAGVRQWVKEVAGGALHDGDYTCSGNYLDYLSGLGVAADTNGNVFVAGFQDGASGGDQNGFVAKYTRNGSLSWKKAFGTPRADLATSVATYDGSEVFMGGATDGFLVHRQLGEGDAVMRELNSSGNLVWSR